MVMKRTLTVAATLLCLSVLAQDIPKVAIYPWTFAENEKGTNQTAIDTATSTLQKLFSQRGQMQILPDSAAQDAWKELGFPDVPQTVSNPSKLPSIDTKQLLALGKKLGVDYVCAGTLAWKVKSVWVALGPKTKADATLNIVIVDVNKGQVVLQEKDFNSASTRAEKWYETAGAILVTWGITVFSGGPKTPQMQNAAIRAIGAATEPFFGTLKRKAG